MTASSTAYTMRNSHHAKQRSRRSPTQSASLTSGVGALVDLPNLSALVMGLDDWPKSHATEISEERLLASVQDVLGPPSIPTEWLDRVPCLGHRSPGRFADLLRTSWDHSRLSPRPQSDESRPPNANRLVRRRFSGPAKVVGGPGTGKTVVAMHRIRYLARSVFNAPADRLLFTTFTANLARNVGQNLRGFCGEEMSRIDVVHLHSWAAAYLKSQGSTLTVADGDDLDACWDAGAAAAPGFSKGFLLQEWEQVVRANGLTDEAGYLAVSRTGRGGTVSRLQRLTVWRGIQAYRDALQGRGKCEWADLVTAARTALLWWSPLLGSRVGSSLGWVLSRRGNHDRSHPQA